MKFFFKPLNPYINPGILVNSRLSSVEKMLPEIWIKKELEREYVVETVIISHFTGL